MSSAVAELEAGLQAMLSLKPPGVSGSKISGITALCTANVQVCRTHQPISPSTLRVDFKLHANIISSLLQSESVLIQKLYTHFKKAPGTHKLGVLYVVDSVTRKWTEQAKSAGQTINSSAPDGTFAAGVHRVKELLPVLMNDIIQTAPDDQKVRSNMLALSSLQAYQHICISCGIPLPPPRHHISSNDVFTMEPTISTYHFIYPVCVV
jgi:protein NRD1